MAAERKSSKGPGGRAKAKGGHFNTVFDWSSASLKSLDVDSLEINFPAGYPVRGASVGLESGDKHAIIKAIKQGFPISSFENLQREMEVSAKRLAEVTRIAGRTLNRRRKEGRLQPSESERLLRVGVLFDRALEVLGEKEAARHWFKTSNKALGGRSPLEFADTEPGAREVEELLGRIEHGIFS